ncbi:hypothetical protein B566_EDAN009715 [Ephemera danica]|nr:hypothetical protein B566_EDAN009715 [Ephemera danica]
MQNVEVKLPPGLDPPRDKDMLHLSNCGVLPRPGDASSKKQSGDLQDSEVRGLLPKNNERHGRNPSGDSSGCSSGHDSVSSSLTSNTQISSDSGAEVDQVRRP